MAVWGGAANFSFGFDLEEFSDRTLILRSPTQVATKNVEVIEGLDEDASVRERRISVCGLILAKGASFFHAMFTNDFKEKESGEYVIQIPQEDWHVYTAILQYLYNPSDNFLDTCSLRDALLFLRYADEIQSEAAAGAALSRLKMVELSPDVCDNFLCLSPTVQSLEEYQDLKTKVQEYLVERFHNTEETWISDDFLQLGINSILLLLRSDDIVTRSENSVWTLLIKWIEGSPFERRMEDIYPYIRFPCMTPSFLVDIVQNSKYFREINEMKELVLESVNYLSHSTDPEQQKWIRTHIIPPEHQYRYKKRKCPLSKLRVFCWDVSLSEIRSLQENQSIDSPMFISGGYAFDLFIKREEYFGLYLEFLPEKTKIRSQFRLPKATWSVWAKCKSNANSPKCLKATSKNFTSDMRPGLGFGHANVFNKPWKALLSDDFDFCIDGVISFTVKLEGV